MTGRSSTRPGCRIRSARRPGPGDATVDDLVSGRAWSHLLDGAAPRRPRSCCPTTCPGTRRTWRRGSGTSSCCWASGRTRRCERRPTPCSPSAPPAWTTSTSGAWTAPTASTRARRCGAARRTASGATAAAPVTSGCSRWPAWPPRPTSLLDELDLGPGGEVELIALDGAPRGELAAHRRERHAAGGAPLLLRLGHRGGVVALDRAHGRWGAGASGAARRRTRGRSWPAS